MDRNNYLSLGQASSSQHTPGNPSPSTVWRWCRKGVKSRAGESVRLQHVRAGGKIFTSQKWLDEFFSKLAASDVEYFSRQDETAPQRPTGRPPQQREKQIQAARVRLQEAGVC